MKANVSSFTLSFTNSKHIATMMEQHINVRERISQIISRTLRVPVPSQTLPVSNGVAEVIQLDTALMWSGFKLSTELFIALSKLPAYDLQPISGAIVSSVESLIGADKRHNVYFRDFPNNVPDTWAFWLDCLISATGVPHPDSAHAFWGHLGIINLLDLPMYGRYLHTFEEMAASHTKLVTNGKERMTILQLGGNLEEETERLFGELSGSSVPLSESDRALVAVLAREVSDTTLRSVNPPVRENRALVNMERIRRDQEIITDSPTDVLRLACEISGGDPTLVHSTRFRSMTRTVRRLLMQSLENIVTDNPEVLMDVYQHKESWKRLGESLHAREHAQKYPNGYQVFAIARRDLIVRSLASRVESAFFAGDVLGAVALLSSRPGMLVRSFDRILSMVEDLKTLDAVLLAFTDLAPKVSTRVLLSLREHLLNRTNATQGELRLFVNSRGTSHVATETRNTFASYLLEPVFKCIDSEVARRIAVVHERAVFDPSFLGIALPLSQKTQADGFGILPRGSITPLSQSCLTFFMYWKQTSSYVNTDFDLSAVLLNREFSQVGQVSWTNIRDIGGVHSGDIVSAPHGASEFISLDLDSLHRDVSYIVPSVNIHWGESFLEVAESFFGYMERERAQFGLPFEARTVRIKSEMRGDGRVCLPLVFVKTDTGTWHAKWLSVYLPGMPQFNRTEFNQYPTAQLTESLARRVYLNTDYYRSLLLARGVVCESFDPYTTYRDPVLFIGHSVPEGLPAGSQVVTPSNLGTLIV